MQSDYRHIEAIPIKLIATPKALLISLNLRKLSKKISFFYFLSSFFLTYSLKSIECSQMFYILNHCSVIGERPFVLYLHASDDCASQSFSDTPFYAPMMYNSKAMTT